MNFITQRKALILVTLISFLTYNSYSQKVDDTTENKCTCSTQGERSKRYVPPLSLMLKFEDFIKSTEWELENGLNDFNELYFNRLRSDRSFDGVYYSTILSSSKPIKILHPNKTFTLNLTPCINLNNHYEVNTNLSVPESIDYNFKEFDNTAKSYLDISLKIIGHRRSIVADEALIKDFWVDKYKYDNESFDKLILEINQEYGFKIKSDYFVDDYEGFADLDVKIDEIINLLKGKVSLSYFILQKYILSDSSNHKINDTEEENLKILLRSHIRNFSVEWVNESILKKQYRGSFITNKLGIELNSNIIKNEKTNDVTSILVGTKHLDFSNVGNLNINTKEVCKDSYEILNTSITITFKDITLTAPSKNEINKKRISINRNFDHNEKDRELMLKKIDFSGIMVHDAIIKIPYKKNVIEGVGNNLLLNNKFISGSFDIFRGKTKLSFSSLKKHLEKLGLEEVKIVEDENVFRVNFNNVLNN